MITHIKFGFAFEYFWFDDTPKDKPLFRFYSGRIHGPVCPTRREAFFKWWKNWVSTFQIIKKLARQSQTVDKFLRA